MDIEPMVTLKEAAAVLRVSEKTLKAWCASGKVPCVKIGRGWRLNRRDLEELTKPKLALVPDDKG